MTISFSIKNRLPVSGRSWTAFLITKRSPMGSGSRGGGEATGTACHLQTIGEQNQKAFADFVLFKVLVLDIHALPELPGWRKFDTPAQCGYQNASLQRRFKLFVFVGTASELLPDELEVVGPSVEQLVLVATQNLRRQVLLRQAMVNGVAKLFPVRVQSGDLICQCFAELLKVGKLEQGNDLGNALLEFHFLVKALQKDFEGCHAQTGETATLFFQ